MTRRSPSPDPEPHRPGAVRPSGPGTLVPMALLALVLGWAIRPLSIRLDRALPVISLWSVVVIWLLALGLALLARRTWRNLQRGQGERLQPYQAVNRLLLGKASAMAGAVVLGGYLGFAIAHLGITATDLGTQRLIRSLFAGVGGAGILAAGLWLEQACRVRPGDDQGPAGADDEQEPDQP